MFCLFVQLWGWIGPHSALFCKPDAKQKTLFFHCSPHEEIHSHASS